ncbi:response regulator [Magnetospira sp. QH-2]|uniref:response regulator n=1 Tax=Magnetospira sp. (strain QH-2) TaxID=1288970 RepID=UPI0003E80F80|nr:response regulator [Magnetospira sp. QH-2]CCQ74841.1 putative response regulator receiver protein [Magnetospira sp. QH-2]
MQPRTRPVKILFAEADADDARRLSEAFKALPTSTEIHHVETGGALIDFVTGKDDSAPRPDLILLGLELPPESGREVLIELKSSEALRAIPVIVFSRSANEADRRTCYDLGANAFVRKPDDPEAFVQAVQALEKFWMQTARLPGLQEMNFFSTGASFT